MKSLSVNELAKLSGVSVRTLHHYDAIGLLKPSARTDSNYRLYSLKEMQRLQQILLYREMDLPLDRIREILDDPGFNMLSALQQHRAAIAERKEQLGLLLQTIDNSIQQLKNNHMDYNEMYKGFSKEQAEVYQKEASDRWGKDTIDASHQRILAMNKNEWQNLQKTGDEIYRSLTSQQSLPPDHPQVQELISRHYALMGKFFDVTIPIYESMGSMYVEDDRFRATFDAYDPGLAASLRDAIQVFCKARQ